MVFIIWNSVREVFAHELLLIQEATLLGHYLVKVRDQIAGHLGDLHFVGNIADGDNNTGGEWLSSLFYVLAYYESFDRTKGRLLLNCFLERFLFSSLQRLSVEFRFNLFS